MGRPLPAVAARAAGIALRRAVLPPVAQPPFRCMRPLGMQGAILGRDKVGLKFNIATSKLAEVRVVPAGWVGACLLCTHAAHGAGWEWCVHVACWLAGACRAAAWLLLHTHACLVRLPRVPG